LLKIRTDATIYMGLVQVESKCNSTRHTAIPCGKTHENDSEIQEISTLLQDEQVRCVELSTVERQRLTACELARGQGLPDLSLGTVDILNQGAVRQYDEGNAQGRGQVDREQGVNEIGTALAQESFSFNFKYR
jgi:hypothetical protein